MREGGRAEGHGRRPEGIGSPRRLVHTLALLCIAALPFINGTAGAGTALAQGTPPSSASPIPRQSTQAAPSSESSVESGTVPILVKFKGLVSTASANSDVAGIGGQTVKDFPQIHTRVINVPGALVDKFVASYGNHPDVQHVSKAVTFAKASVPNDPGYGQQWALPKIAWDQAYGTIDPAGSAKIAILDTGVDATHPDLSGQMTTGISEIGGDPNLDPNGHGTELAGIAAASVNNGVGMAGVDYAGAGISSVQVLGSDGTGTDANVVAGVLWAADNGAKVILMAFYSMGYSSALADAVAYAEGKGVVVVAATGNSASSTPTYPAGDPGVIGVASTDQNDNLSSTSDLVSADVAAPGVGVYSTQPGGSYGFISGTSASAAEVAGLAGLLVANGDSTTQTYSQITGATDPISGRSFGRINVLKALGGPPVTVTPQPTASTTPTAGPSPTYVAAANMILTPSSGAVGSSVAVSGQAWTHGGKTLTFTWDGAALTPTGACTTLTNGHISSTCTFQVPSSTLGPHTVFATDNSSPTPDTASATFTVNLGPATQYLVSSSNYSPVAGTAVTITAQLADAGGHPVSTSGKVVTWSKTGSGGSFSSPTTTTNSSGVATVTFTTGNTANTTYTVTATDNTSLTGTSAAITTVAGAATQYLVTSTNYSPVAGTAVTITAQLADANGNPVSTTGKTVTWSKTGAGGSFGSPTSITNGNGVASVTFTTGTTANTTYTVTATDNTSLTGTSSAITTVVGPASKLVFNTISSPTTAGATLNSPGGVTVTAEDANSNVVSTYTGNITVSFGNNAGGGTLSGTLTKGASSGTATFTDLSINKAGTGYTLSASGVGITGSFTSNAFDITPGAVSAGTSTVVASPTSVTADGTATSTITVTLRDANSNPVSGKTVTLAQGTGSSTISAASGPSTAGGVVTFAVKDTKAETVTYTATDSTDSIIITQTAQVTFTSGAVTAGNSTVVASPTTVTADGSTTSTITVTLNDAHNNPVSGKSVTLSQGSGSSTISAASGPSTAGGVVTFTVKDTKAETVTYTATDTTDSNLVITQTAQVTFTAGAVTAGNSKLVASPTSVTADGSTTSTVTVTLNDAHNNPVSGKTVTLSQGSGSSTISAASGPSTAGGVVTFTVKDMKAETVTYTATDTTDSVVITQTAQVTFTAGAVTAGNSTVVASPTSVPADGSTVSTITVTLNDAHNNPVSGKSVTLTAGSGSSTITTVSSTTSSSGQASFTVKDGTGESVTYTAKDTTDNVTVTQAATVTFTPIVSAGNSTVVASPTSVPADGSTTSTITVTLKDGGNNPVSGKTVTLTAGSGASTMITTSGTTNGSGVATFTVKDSTAQSVTYTAKDTTDAPNVTVAQTATVTFTASKLVFSTITDTVAGSSLNDGSGFTVTAEDAFNNVVTTYTGSITISIGTNPSSGTLSGTLVRMASSGIATFTGVSIDKTGTGYTLSATDGTIGGMSNTFNITARSTSTSVSCAATTVTINSGTTCTATVTDTDGNGTKTSPTGQVTWSVSPSNGGFTTAGGSNFTAPNKCTLSSSGSSTSGCSVTYTATTYGSPSLTGAYSGDGAHSGSSSAPFVLTATVGLCAGATTASLAMCGVSLTANFPNLTLNGRDQSAFASLSNINIQDQQASGTAGWNVTVQASRLSCTSADGPHCPTSGDTLPAGELQMAGPLAEGTSGSQCYSGCGVGGPLSLPQSTTPFLIDTGTSVKIASYANGDPSYVLKPGTVDGTAGHNLMVTVPEDAYASTYHTTITLTVVTGP